MRPIMSVRITSRLRRGNDFSVRAYHRHDARDRLERERADQNGTDEVLHAHERDGGRTKRLPQAILFARRVVALDLYAAHTF